MTYTLKVTSQNQKDLHDITDWELQISPLANIRQITLFDKNISGKRNLDYLCAALPKTVLSARVAELVDALDSKSSDSNIVRVRFPPRVLMGKSLI